MCKQSGVPYNIIHSKVNNGPQALGIPFRYPFCKVRSNIDVHGLKMVTGGGGGIRNRWKKDTIISNYRSYLQSIPSTHATSQNVVGHGRRCWKMNGPSCLISTITSLLMFFRPLSPTDPSPLHILRFAPNFFFFFRCSIYRRIEVVGNTESVRGDFEIFPRETKKGSGNDSHPPKSSSKWMHSFSRLDATAEIETLPFFPLTRVKLLGKYPA